MAIDRFAARILRGLASRLQVWANALYVPPPPEPSAREITHAQWLAANGDRTLRLDYPLNEDSIVLDVGGFEGQWASDIFSRYLCQVHVFEPVPQFADLIESRFAANQRIKVHRRALGATTGKLAFAVQGDESSAHITGQQTISVDVVTLESVLQSEKIGEVALMKVNVEGGEYDLLEHVIEIGLMRRIQRLQVQFHDFVPDAARRMNDIQSRLGTTHRPTYTFPFVWESWSRKDVA